MRSRLGSRPTPPAFLLGPVIILLLLANALVVLARNGDAPEVTVTPSVAAPADAAPAPPPPPDPQPGVVLPSPAAPASTAPSSPNPSEPTTPSSAPSSAPTEAPPAPPAQDVDVGTCFDGSAATVGQVLAVPCDGPHGNEIYVLTTAPGEVGAPYAGEESLLERAGELCRGQDFQAYVGIPWADSRLFTSPIVPTAESWAAGDRRIACLLYDLQGPRTASARGAAV